ncbi:MAG: monovalent cation/H(+) antiporter subunit G [Nitrospiria bacterium]
MQVVVITLILLGLFFLIVSAIGMVRLPDVYTRSHALGVTDTLGVGLVLSGLALYQGLTIDAVKTVLILVLLYHLNPVISHATVRAALRSGQKPWTREGIEDEVRKGK